MYFWKTVVLTVETSTSCTPSSPPYTSPERTIATEQCCLSVCLLPLSSSFLALHQSLNYSYDHSPFDSLAFSHQIISERSLTLHISHSNETESSPPTVCSSTAVAGESSFFSRWIEAPWIFSCLKILCKCLFSCVFSEHHCWHCHETHIVMLKLEQHFSVHLLSRLNNERQKSEHVHMRHTKYHNHRAIIFMVNVYG